MLVSPWPTHKPASPSGLVWARRAALILILTSPGTGNIFTDMKFPTFFLTILFPIALLAAGTQHQPSESPKAAVDLNGDRRTDFVVARNTGGGSGGQLTWYTKFTGITPTTPVNWGIASDTLLSADFDGDTADDMAVWRSSNGTFYILHSSTYTVRIDQLGQAGDDPTIIADYNGDGRDDTAVYRPGSPSTWYYRPSPDAFFTAVNWGQSGDIVAPGDYDGDGRSDFVVYRPGCCSSTWYKRLTTEGFSTEDFSFPGSVGLKVIPGDYDGDGRTDISMRGMTLIGNVQWHYEPSGTPGSNREARVVGSLDDVPVPGDYDGDGRTDFAIWRPSTGRFHIIEADTGNEWTDEWGEPGDIPVAAFNVH
jgi:spore coat protein A, manganese oxidase